MLLVIVHSDLHRNNIIIEPGAPLRVWIIDYGVSKKKSKIPEEAASEEANDFDELVGKYEGATSPYLGYDPFFYKGSPTNVF